MKIRHWILLITLIGASTWLIIITGDIAPRVDKNIDLNWRFIQDDQIEFSNVSFNDSQWKFISLPHEWKDLNSCAWYRKEFSLSKHESKKQFYLQFDCLNNISDIWLNGKHIGGNIDSIGSQIIDISKYVRIDSINVMAIRSCDKENTTIHSGGIFGHVNLIATELLHFPVHSATVKTSLQDNNCLINSNFTLTNNEKRAKHFKIRSDLLDPEGHLIRSVITSRNIEGNSSISIIEKYQVENPRIWTPNKPKQYEIRNFLIYKKKVSDLLVTPFAVKNITFTPDSGLYINKQKTPVRGIIIQHNKGITNLAIPDASWKYRLNTLKKLGFNMLSFPEYYASPNLSNLCEKLGFLLLNEDPANYNLEKHEFIAENHIITQNGDVKPYAYYSQSFQKKPMLKLSVLNSEEKYKEIEEAGLLCQTELSRHWNFEKKEKKEVLIFTNCEKVSLQLNEQKPYELKKSNFKEGLIHKNIPYVKGKLYVTATLPDNTILIDSLITAGPAKMILMQADKKGLTANGNDFVHIKTSVTDSSGIQDPNADHLIKYTLEGPGKFKYAENDTFAKRVQRGSHLLIVQSGIEPGDLTIKAKADGLKPAKLKIKSEELKNN